MELSVQQDQALKKVAKWLADPHAPQVFRFFGPAGSGKTSLARHFAQNVDGEVLFAAPTGKAAHVLHKKGCPNTSTIHSLIYSPKDKSKERLRQLEAEKIRLEKDFEANVFKLGELAKKIAAERANVSRPSFSLNLDSALKRAKLLICDEVSMVDRQVGADLASFGVKILALGDPFQLQPIYGPSYFPIADPEVLLTEIHRQAKDNSIIRIATALRSGQGLTLGEHRGVDEDGQPVMSRVLRGKDIGKEAIGQIVIGVDQLIVGRNATRRTSNDRMRAMLGRTKTLPMKNDKLICLRNNREIGLLNGQIWFCEEDSELDGRYINLHLRGEEGEHTFISAHQEPFLGKEVSPWCIKDSEMMDWGYSITTHKSQGSSWPRIAVFDEWPGADWDKWMYTAVTRAEREVDIIKL